MTKDAPVDLSEPTATAVASATTLASNGKLQEGLDQLLALEKQSRSGGDLASTTKLLITILDLIHAHANLDMLITHVQLLSKKHGQLKDAILRMIQHAIRTYIAPTASVEERVKVTTALRDITEGKIYLESERAELTLQLATIHEREFNDVGTAATLLQDIAIETFGSVPPKTKTEFILEQIRTTIANGDYTKAQILSRKINTKFLDADGNETLKVRYYRLMVEYAEYKEAWLDVGRYWWNIYNTSIVKGTSLAAEEEEEELVTPMEDDASSCAVSWQEALKHVMMYTLLAPADSERTALLHTTLREPRSKHLDPYYALATRFSIHELLPWPEFLTTFAPILRASPTFNPLEKSGVKRWQELKKRVMEHNLVVISAYYSRVTLLRLAGLLSMPKDETESMVATMVTDGTIHARMDRVEGIVVFEKRPSVGVRVEAWRRDVVKVLDTMEDIGHWINKEEMVHKLVKV